MIQNKHIINSLPLLAAALGCKYGVDVVIGGDRACTDGRTIYLPSLPQDCDATLLGLVRGYIDHGAAHLRETGFGLLKKGKPPKTPATRSTALESIAIICSACCRKPARSSAASRNLPRQCSECCRGC